MDFQKEREAFENYLKKIGKTDNETFSRDEDGSYQMDIIHFGWKIWKDAKAQSVPNTQQALNDRLLVKSIREHVESHIAEISVNDLFDKGWVAAMKCIQNNIDMLEAQEPSQTQP